MKAAPGSDGRWRKNSSSASTPPAEHPIPTIGNAACLWVTGSESAVRWARGLFGLATTRFSLTNLFGVCLEGGAIAKFHESMGYVKPLGPRIQPPQKPFLYSLPMPAKASLLLSNETG